MTLPRDAMLLRIFIAKTTEARRAGRFMKPLCSKRAMSISPVRRCCAGRWDSDMPNRLHTTKILQLSEDLPLIIAIVDTEAKKTSCRFSVR